MAEQLLPGYYIRRGSTLDRARLVKFMQQTYQEMFPHQDFSHLAKTVEQYLSNESPLWWVEKRAGGAGGAGEDNRANSPPVFPATPAPVACLWVGNAIDQVCGDRYTHVFLLYVVPEHRRQGIGKALMRYVENWALHRGDRQISLQVFESNQPALNLYNQIGYQTQSLWMVKSLHTEK